MRDYFIRRFLLIPPTLLGVTLLVFVITRFAPGGPVEKALHEAQKATEDGGSSSGQAGGVMSEEQIEELEEEYGYDKSIIVAYLQWLGVMSRERLLSKAEFQATPVRNENTIGADTVINAENTVVLLKGTGLQAKVNRDGRQVTAVYLNGPRAGKKISRDDWQIRIESERDRQARWSRREDKAKSKAPDYNDRVVIYKSRFSGLLQGNLGRSTEFGDPVWDLIKSRIPVALYFGILTAILTYGICLPLGILKAIKHRTAIDNLTSVLIFIGYAIPGFALGSVLLVYLGARGGWFPMFGLTDPDFDSMSLGAQIINLAHHTILPLLCYVVGSFAWLTMMMKNNLMDNLAADYVRTAVSKGVSFRSAVFKHAFRNSFIPIASTLGQLITLLVSGSILIESVFDIQGFGLLQYQALLGRDSAVIMGTLTIAAFLLVLGNILSDVIVAMVDPRVKFN